MLTRQEIIDAARRFLFRRRHAYQITFKGPLAQEVLRDLAVFCYANTSTFNADDRKATLAEGRREVWLRIANHLNMPPEELWRLYDGRSTD